MTVNQIGILAPTVEHCVRLPFKTQRQLVWIFGYFENQIQRLLAFFKIQRLLFFYFEIW